MNQEIPISVYEVVGNPMCIATDDGHKVHGRISKALKEDRKVRLSFLNVSHLTSAFLNAAIGQLYGEFSENVIKDGIQISDMEQDDLKLLKRVVHTAKAYFRDPERLSRARRIALEEDDDQ